MFAIEGTKFFVLQMFFFTFKDNTLNDGTNQSYEKEDSKKVVTHNKETNMMWEKKAKKWLLSDKPRMEIA